MKQTETRFNLEQYKSLAVGIRLQLANLSSIEPRADAPIKNHLAPILTKLLKAIERLDKETK